MTQTRLNIFRNVFETNHNPRFICSLIFAFTISALFSGCSNEPEATYVDFSHRIIVEQPGDQPRDGAYFKVAVGSMISAKETAVNYHQLLDYIAGKLGRKIELVQRKTYGEINELIGEGQIDLAFICSGPYAFGKDKYGFEALAMPEIRGTNMYQSYLIVNIHSPYKKLEDLSGKTFAFTDPGSNTGKLVPTYWLKQQEKTPEDFFGKVIYTYSHDNSIMAVAMSMVDGAAVHGQIWEYYHRKDPAVTSRTRIIKKSESFGNPPVVASSHLPLQIKMRMREILFQMHRDETGKKILDELMIDRFIEPQKKCYEPILAMKDTLDE
jgi:phosphonate transport system substrate-binding protein